MEQQNSMMKRLIVIFGALFVIGGVILAWFFESRPVVDNSGPKQNIVDVVDRGISAEDMPLFDEKIESVAKEIADKQQAGEEDISLYLRLGNAYYSAGQLAKAVEQYNLILKDHPQDAAALENKAQALSEAGDFEGAKVAWYAALAVDPREETYIKLSNFLLDKEPDSSKEVLRLLEEGVQNNGQTVGLMVALGNANRKIGDLELAVTYYDIATKLAPEDTSLKDELKIIQTELSAERQKNLK